MRVQSEPGALRIARYPVGIEPAGDRNSEFLRKSASLIEIEYATVSQRQKRREVSTFGWPRFFHW